MRIARLLFLISVLLASVTVFAEQSRMARELDRAATREMVVAALQKYRSDYPTKDMDSMITRAETGDWQNVRDEFPGYELSLSVTGSVDKGRVSDAAAEAKRILSKGAYRDVSPTEARNWVGDGIKDLVQTISNWLSDLLEKIFANRKMPNFGGLPILNNLVPAIQWILGTGVVIFALFFLAKFRFGRSAKKKVAGGLLDEDEPDRTADEWVLEAERLTAEGKHREAVRCLYIGSLVRLDELKVMPFDRHETNWEHLRRFESSPRRPAELDLRAITRKFDFVWYGKRTEGLPDVEILRAFYAQILSLKQNEAA